MNRRSLIKSLFTIAIAPKALIELKLYVPRKAYQVREEFIPVKVFTIKDFNALVRQLDNYEPPKYFWYENAKIHNG